ncbi:MAG: SDR family NAD(P)-dependent oxidoreductase [Geminicoccaceae bacterium]
MQFQGKSVLITGAASGFGRLAAERFAAEGANLALGDINEAALDDAATIPLMNGVEVITRRCDVSVEADAKALVDAAVERLGSLDIAINNAGIGHRLARLPELDLDEYEKVMRVNAGGVFLGMKHQLPVMSAAGAGVILNVASAAGLVGAGMLSAYAASKHAVIGLTRSAADEYARFGIRVNALCPSFADTPLFNDMADAISTDREEAYKRITTRIPMRRVAKPAEIVPTILWLCVDENSFMTGQAIAVDGGLTAV